MLEIPESNTIARQFKESVCGKTIANVVAGQSPHGFAFYFGDPATYSALLAGKQVEDAKAVGGQVELIVGDARILWNDGVNIRYLEAETAPSPKHQMYIGFEDGTKIVCTVQMYAGLYAYPAGANDSAYYAVAKEKPSPLSDAFDAGYFEKLFRATNPKLSVKALLAAEQRIPGLGNGCLQDILFHARIHPQTKLSALHDGAMHALFDSVKSTLSEMAAQGGRDTEKDLFGHKGGYKTLMSNKTLHDPCTVCGGTISRKAYMGGNVYFCPNCQKER